MKTHLVKITKSALSTIIGVSLAAAVPAAELVVVGTTSKQTLAAAGLIGIAGWWHRRNDKTSAFPVDGEK
jgi:hypothetical protein